MDLVLKWVCGEVDLFCSFTQDSNPAQPHQKRTPSKQKERRKNTGTEGPPWELAAILTGSLSNRPRDGRIRSRHPGKTQTTKGRTLLSLVLEAFQMYTCWTEKEVWTRPCLYLCVHIKQPSLNREGAGGASTPSLSATYNVALRTLPRWLNYSSHLVSRQLNNSTWWQCRIRRQKHETLQPFSFFLVALKKLSMWGEMKSHQDLKSKSSRLNLTLLRQHRFLLLLAGFGKGSITQQHCMWFLLSAGRWCLKKMWLVCLKCNGWEAHPITFQALHCLSSSLWTRSDRRWIRRI